MLSAHDNLPGGVCWSSLGDGGICPCNRYKFPETPEVPENEGKTTMAEAMKYELPNGRKYLARALGGFDDDVIGMRELVKQHKHVLLLADPGVGKTALFQAAFPDAENEIGHSKMTAWDMLWRWQPKADGTYVAHPAPLTRAVTRGVPLYLDEAMRLSEDAWTPLFSAMDGRGFIIGGNLDQTDMEIKEGFCVIAASNPLVRGAFLPDAIASRFHILTVETSEDLLERLGLDERLLVIWRNLSKTDGGETWRPSIRELLSAQEFIDAGNMAQAAYALTGWRVPARDRETVAGVVAPLLGVRVGKFGGVIK
jgi:nitric oxide reductase NorQ protein